MYREKLFIKIEQYNERFKDSFPLMLVSDIGEGEIIEKIDECLLTDKKIHIIVDWFKEFDNPEIDG